VGGGNLRIIIRAYVSKKVVSDAWCMLTGAREEGEGSRYEFVVLMIGNRSQTERCIGPLVRGTLSVFVLGNVAYLVL
jgi:hypothetical protein